MFSPDELARAAKLKRNTTILEQTAPASAGGVSASVIGGNVRLTAWIPEQEISIELTAREVFDLRYFLNAVVDAVMTGSEFPASFIGCRR